ncbi:hypothetical protein N9954_03170 [Maribacter sp.]|nr:hypothetical protein [Maribacter sp.]
MSLKKQMSSGRYVVQLVKRKISMLLIAFMLGMSNVILEEDRMVHDTREHIELQELAPEDDLLNAIDYDPDGLEAF